MYTINDDTRKLIYSGDAQYVPYLKIGTTDIDVSLIKNITISDPILDKETKYFYLGTFPSRKIEIEFVNSPLLNIDFTQQVEFNLGIKSFITGEELDVIPYGNYYVDMTSENYYNNNKLTAYDYAIKMKKPLVDITNPETTPFNTNEEGKLTSVNIVDLLQWICDYCGVELGDFPDVNNDMIISSYDNTISGKAYISYIAELMGGYAKIGRDNKLYIKPAKIEPIMEIDVESAKDFKIGEKYKITKVVYDNGILVPSIIGNDTGNTLFIRTDNFLISGDDETRDYIVENIYNEVYDLEIYPIEIDKILDPSIDPYDMVTYTVGDNARYNTYYDYTYSIGQTGKVKTTLPTAQQEATTNVNDNASTNSKMRAIRTYIDQENSTIRTEISNTKDTVDSLGEQVTELDRLVQTYTDTYTKTEIQQIISGIGVDGQVVTSVITESATFDKNGLTIDNDSKENIFKSNLNEKGLSIIDKNANESLLYVGADEKTGETVVKTMNMNVNKYLHIGTHSRLQDFELTEDEYGKNVKATAVFWLGE